MSKTDKYRIKVLKRQIADGDLDAMMEYAQRYQCRFPEYVTPEIVQKNRVKTSIDAGKVV